MNTPFCCPECGCPLPRAGTVTVPAAGWPSTTGCALLPSLDGLALRGPVIAGTRLAPPGTFDGDRFGTITRLSP